jgi:hypothetical protein
MLATTLVKQIVRRAAATASATGCLKRKKRTFTAATNTDAVVSSHSPGRDWGANERGARGRCLGIVLAGFNACDTGKNLYVETAVPIGGFERYLRVAEDGA